MKIRKRFEDFSLYLDPFLPGISGRLLRKGQREQAFMSLLRREVSEGMTVLDIGANVGYQAFTMASIVGDGGHVFAVEPDPRNLRLLRDNVRLNGWDNRVSVHACAVSDHDGTAPFRVARRSNLNSLAVTRHTRDSKTIEIPVVSLDSFFADRPPPSFIKMDIEGHEVEVLRGFEQTLRNRPFLLRVLMEVHPVMYTEQHSLRQVLERYLSLGFHCKYLVSAAEPRPPAIARRGYEPTETVAMKDKHQRAIYANLPDEEALDFACRLHDGVKVARALLIERPAPAAEAGSTPDTQHPAPGP